MSASIRFPNHQKQFTRGWRMSSNAKRNRKINGGTTAATAFYLRWSY
ncbi:TPA: hypothetical protein ACPOXD_001159 [Haemophilus influenzae]|nr:MULTISPECIES: hypothetical protein [Haemophilus]DAW72795.1 MAG TPA: hypothetical protein [Caudoviricetes sp.]MCK8793586.1 hypothetical protein [Haemophilus influenzae]MCK8823116.1 hypothetical protein [Haemophilus influenzae]MCK8848382.1 hypothetical protein [Haemophilus influenzae]MCK8930830.1 hypothetical protein [Haemophilus influenzae]